MSKKKSVLIERMKEGESVSGELVEVDDKKFVVETDDKKITVLAADTEDFLEDFEGENVKITRVGRTYEVEEI